MVMSSMSAKCLNKRNIEKKMKFTLFHLTEEMDTIYDDNETSKLSSIIDDMNKYYKTQSH